VAYIKYSKTLKNIMSDERYLLVLTLNYVVALPGLTIFQLQKQPSCKILTHIKAKLRNDCDDKLVAIF